MAQFRPTKAYAFDLFGTYLSLDGLPQVCLDDYAEQIVAPAPYRPFTFAPPWRLLEPHAGAQRALESIVSFALLATMSNASIPLQLWYRSRGLLDWASVLIPLELAKLKKPRPAAYEFACIWLDMDPHEVSMVTANESFGDLEQAATLGMQPILVGPTRGLAPPGTVWFKDLTTFAAAVRHAAGEGSDGG